MPALCSTQQTMDPCHSGENPHRIELTADGIPNESPVAQGYDGSYCTDLVPRPDVDWNGDTLKDQGRWVGRGLGLGFWPARL